MQDNMQSMNVNIVVEGITDEAVAKRLLELTGLTIGNIYGLRGKQHILKQLQGYNTAATYRPWLVIVDLDSDADCVVQAVQNWLPKTNHEKGMCFRIAVREIEAWLLADAEHLAQFLHVSSSILPASPDKELHPKQTLVNIARTSSKSYIREDIVPRQGAGSVVGPGYTSKLIEFTQQYWHPDQAMQHSESLQRCMKALLKWVRQME